jgi:serine protease Do
MYTKKIIFLLVGFISLFGSKGSAQEPQPNKKQKKEIIIHEGSDSSKKMIVIVNGDKVTVNGKEYNGDEKNEFIIKRRKNGMMSPDAFIMMDEPSFFDMEELDDNNKASLGVLAGKDDKGAVVLEVLPGSAAEKAGLKQNDLIISISGKKIAGPQELSETIKAKKPNDKVEVQYLRDGKTQSVNVTLEARKSMSRVITMQKPNGADRNMFFEDLIEDEMGRNGLIGNFPNHHPKLGLEIQDTEDEKGVKITDVEDGSSAEKNGLKTGDIILSIDEQKIANVADAKAAIRKDKQSLKFNMLRDGKPLQLEVKLPKILKKATL